MYSQWQVILVPFPFSDLSGAKKRPAVIVSGNTFNKNHADVVCCLVTSNTTPEAGCPNIRQGDMKNGILHFESKIKPYRLFTIGKTLIVSQMGELAAAKASETKAELIKLFQ